MRAFSLRAILVFSFAAAVLRFLVIGWAADSLALLLFQSPGRLMSRDYLREAIWGQNAEVLSRTLDTHISRLRQQLQLRPGAQYAITAVYGLGYRLDSQTEGVTV